MKKMTNKYKLLSLVLLFVCLLSSSVFGVELEDKPDGYKNYYGNGLNVKFEHLSNTQNKQTFELIIEADTDRTIDPKFVLSEFTGKDSFNSDDLNITESFEIIES